MNNWYPRHCWRGLAQNDAGWCPKTMRENTMAGRAWASYCPTSLFRGLGAKACCSSWGMRYLGFFNLVKLKNVHLYALPLSLYTYYLITVLTRVGFRSSLRSLVLWQHLYIYLCVIPKPVSTSVLDDLFRASKIGNPGHLLKVTKIRHLIVH